MRGIASETVGENFQLDLLQIAQEKTLQVIQEMSSRVRSGMRETEARTLIVDLQKQMGAAKAWHPPQIRFGRNTILPFGRPSQDPMLLGDNDIYFFDIGPIFDQHEGDVGRTFVVGDDPEMRKCSRDAEVIWHEVRRLWQTEQITGPDLYAFASERAKFYGWKLNLEKANGHRIADFPHAARERGSIEEFPHKPAPNRWILEIQIRHPEREFGAFFEDLLN